MAAPDILAEPVPVHTPASAALFLLKRSVLQVKRSVEDRFSGVTMQPTSALNGPCSVVIAEQRSPLWGDETVAERCLQLGKVQNLRLASRQINGLELPRYALFSFWKQVGSATRLRGYAPGRELREGCLIPAIGGGLCQLSNALYAAALDSGAEIVERHAHSRVVPGSAAALGRDATVAFNYVDLRFRFDFDVRIKAVLTGDELVVRFLAHEDRRPVQIPRPKKLLVQLLEPQTTGSCVSCGQDACFRHTLSQALRPPTEQTAYLVDRSTPEFLGYVKTARQQNDALFLPLDGTRHRVARYAWDRSGFTEVNAAPVLVARHALASRLHRSSSPVIARARQLQFAENLANAYCRKLRPEHTHLVVSQDLLPVLWRNGSLGGRTFDVLMTRLPIAVLQERLDAAFAGSPESSTLGDFRAPVSIVEAETAALAAAAKIITPHPELARLFGSRAVLVPWQDLPPAGPTTAPGSNARTIVFPGPTVGRKGCYALREAARKLDIELVILGKNFEHADFWKGVRARIAMPGEDWIASALAVVQPSVWEESPLLLLGALSAGVPVIATAGCGLGDRQGVVTVEFGDSDAIVDALTPLR